MSTPLKKRARHNLILFTLNVIYIFAIGIFEEQANMHFVYFTCISLIFFVSILTIKDTSKHYFYLPASLIILTWVAVYFDMPYLSRASGIVSTLFFLYVIVLLIKRVARSKSVGTLEFLESINVYLLLGIAASLLFGAIYSFDHSAYNPPGEILQSQSDFIYYSFVTLSTLGYGDITPNNSLARSLSIFFSVAGQLYLTMIIAMLVGKYLSKTTDKPA